MIHLPRTPRLVIFDCDGVLIDSEAVVNRVIAEQLTGLGWALTAAESQAAFMGMTLTDMRPVIEARLGLCLPADWVAALAARILDTLAQGVPVVQGAEAALRAVGALGLPWRVASNSSREEMGIKFARSGLDRLIPVDRVHSAGDVIATGGRGKPAPDLFLATAAAEGVPPADCLVIEDSVPGTRGAVAAGMTCLGYALHGGADRLLAAGALAVMRDLAELAPALRLTMQEAA